MAAAAAKTDSCGETREAGLYDGTFFDTIICTMTGLALHSFNGRRQTDLRRSDDHRFNSLSV
ncbi:hypothetical protein O9993_06110 [Vibrio lentus]|nr:hypothetical protein [Vibrio lentus]